MSRNDQEPEDGPSSGTTENRPKRRYLKSEGRLVSSRVNRLQRDYLSGRPSARRDLAELRRAVARQPGDVPEVWSLTEVAADDARGTAPTSSEWAVHIALCLYGLHQQGRSGPAHDPERTFGRAVRALAGDQAEESPIWRRFTAAMLADDIGAVRDHLQGIVGQMHATKAYTPFDYAGLADDLVALQTPEGKSDVRLRWQRDFYSTGIQAASDSETETED